MPATAPSHQSRAEVPWRMHTVWALARAAAWLFYRVERVGPAPPDGPLLLLPNHPNGLLDPAVVVATAGRPARFLAKSTLFSGAPFSFLVRWSGAIPVYRRQDADTDTARNAEMFAAVAVALAQGDAVCLFPEGISHSSGRLAPLKTGAARIALSAEAGGTPVALVAVGLNFSDKGIFRSPALVAYGPPFAGGDLLRPDDPLAPPAVEAVTARIAAHIHDVLVEAEPTSDADVVARVERLYASARAAPRDPAARLAREQAISRGLDVLRAQDPARLARLIEEWRRLERRLTRFGLQSMDAPRAPRSSDALRFLAREVPLAVLLAPPAVAAALLFAVPYVLVDRLARRRGIEHEIQATVKVLGGAVVHGVWTLLLAAVAAWWAGAWPGAAVAVALPLTGVAGVLAMEREGAALDAARSWLAMRRMSPRVLDRLRRRGQALADLLDEAHAWVTSATAGHVPPHDDHPAAPTSRA